MKRFGIIGNPVAHSLSPRLFTSAYHGRYPYDLIEGADFDASWERFLREYDGINVTAPFKEDAFRAVDRLSSEAQRIGAVNLVVKTPEGTVGYNSDYDGVRLALEEAGIPSCRTDVADGLADGCRGNDAAPAGCCRALVIGCGGAGKAAAAAALDLGCTVVLINRTLSRAEALATRLGGTAVASDKPNSNHVASVAGARIIAAPFSSIRDEIRAAHLILYTVPGPLEECPPEGIAALLATPNRPCTLLEANYRDPVFSAGQGYRYISGRRWLLHQAAAGYRRFTGESPDLPALEAAL